MGCGGNGESGVVFLKQGWVATRRCYETNLLRYAHQSDTAPSNEGGDDMFASAFVYMYGLEYVSLSRRYEKVAKTVVLSVIH